MARVLIVEDEHIVAMDMQSTIAGMGHEVVGHASTGEEALELAESVSPDLLLMDVRLNGNIDGIEVARRLNSTLGVPVVYVTAHAEEGVVDRAIQTNIQAYLVKPFDDSELSAAVQVALHNHVVTVEARLREERLGAALRNMRDAVVAVDSDWRITFMNETAEKLAEIAGGQATGRHLSEIVDIRASADDSDNAMATLEEKTEYGGSQITAVLLREHGEPLPVEWHITELATGGTGFLLTIRDVSHYRNRESALRQAAFYDSLTGAPNRRLFEELLGHTVDQLSRRSGYRFGVMYVDLDGFKTVNDEYGHAVGDQLLISVASRLASTSRPSDVVARIGGDEFVVLLENLLGRPDAEGIAARTVRTLNKPYLIDGQEVSVTASLGVALSSLDSTAAQLLKLADEAMYRAKNAGKGRYTVP